MPRSKGRRDNAGFGQSYQKKMIAITTWCLWWERHKLVNGENTQDINQITLGIRAFMTNCVVASSPKATMKRGGWTQQPLGLVKLNFDASFDHDMLSGSTMQF